MSLRRLFDEKANYQDIGLMDAINDTLQDLGIVETKKLIILCDFVRLSQNAVTTSQFPFVRFTDKLKLAIKVYSLTV